MRGPRRPDAMTDVRSPWLVAFALVAAVHLVLNGADVTPWDSISKCLLAPLLAGWAATSGGPRLLVVALGLCFLGDLFLEVDGLFVVGMAAFAGAHVAFMVLFVRRGAVAGIRARPAAAIGYVVVAIGMVAWCWGGLEPTLRPAIPVYAALLVGTAATSAAVDVRAGFGGALFLVSDGIIALSEAGRLDPDATATGVAIMVLYLLAIWLLATGVVRSTPHRTDCWPRPT